MDVLKKIFPYSFGAADVTNLIVRIIIYVLAGAVAGVLIGICAKLPLVGVIIGATGGLVDLYVVVGIVLLVLDYLKVLK